MDILEVATSKNDEALRKDGVLECLMTYPGYQLNLSLQHFPVPQKINLYPAFCFCVTDLGSVMGVFQLFNWVFFNNDDNENPIGQWGKILVDVMGFTDYI